ncbi:MAG: CarD family transcriptional regulator [Clostridia bacterium]|nr:CarD family transcriptional regulator [Clostridia bacterium]
MYKIGDKVIYGQTGVCEVTDICEKAFIKNQKREYYVLKPYNFENNIIYAPVNDNKVFMRELITKSEAEDLIKSIPIIVEKLSKSEEATKEDYIAKINNHSLEELVELTAIIYSKKLSVAKMKKRLNAIDEKYIKIGENLLFSELSAVLGIPIDSVQGYIEDKLK